MKPVPILIVSHNTLPYTRRCIESIIAYSHDPKSIPYRLIIVDNASTDGTLEYLEGLGIWPEGGKVSTNKENRGWVKGVNQGVKLALSAYDPDYIIFANSDILANDPRWLRRYTSLFESNPEAGAIGPVSNFVMGLQKFELNDRFPAVHEANFLIGFFMAVRAKVAREVSELNFGKFLDERFGLGGNDDLDLSIRIRRLGYKLLINRRAFIFHYGSKTLLPVFGGWEGIKREDERTRVLLVEKWGQKTVEDLFGTPQGLMPPQYRERRNPYDTKEAAVKVLEDFDDICREAGVEYRLVAGTCLGFYKYGGFMPWDTDIDVRLIGCGNAWGVWERLKEKGFATEDSEYRLKHWWRDNVLLDIFQSEVSWGSLFDTVEYNGREYKVPYPVEGYLAECYGEDWKTWEPE